MEYFDEYLLRKSESAPSSDADIPRKETKFSLMQEITELEWKIEKCVAEINENLVRNNIVSAHHKKCEKLLKKIEVIKENVTEKLERYKGQKLLSFNENFLPRTLNFESVKSIEETCEMISSYFENEYARKAGLLDIDSANDITKENLWKRIEDVVRSFTHEEISEALMNNVRQSALDLRDMSSKINLKHDGDHLSFRLETGKLKDTSSEPILMQTIRQILEAGQISHFQKFLACEEEKKKTWDLKKKLDSCNAEIDNILASRFDPSKAELIRRYFDAQQENAGNSGSFQYLKEEIVRLNAERNDKAKTLESLLEKYNRIKLFDKTVQAKQLVIQKLIRNNISTKVSHQQQHQNILTSAEQKIIDLQQEITQLCHQYEGLENEEVDCFLKIPIQNLYAINQDNQHGRLVRDMSIHRLNPHFHQPAEDSFKHVLKKLQIPEYASPELILKSIMEKKMLCSSDEAKQRNALTNNKSFASIANKIENLKIDLRKRYEELYLSVIPSLKESERKTSDVIAESSKFKNIVGIWADQPAQFLVPWITLDGYNVKQYTEQFNAQINLLKEMNECNLE